MSSSCSTRPPPLRDHRLTPHSPHSRRLGIHGNVLGRSTRSRPRSRNRNSSPLRREPPTYLPLGVLLLSIDLTPHNARRRTASKSVSSTTAPAPLPPPRPNSTPSSNASGLRNPLPWRRPSVASWTLTSTLYAIGKLRGSPLAHRGPSPCRALCCVMGIPIGMRIPRG